MNKPTITTVIATFNSERTIERCLQSVRDQQYPQSNIDIILVDGGSTDKTLIIAKKFKPQIIHINPKVQHAEYNKGFGIRKARGDLLLLMDHDNILPHKNWISKMIQPLLKHKDIVGVHTLWYHYDKNYALLDRYGALFGTTDPLTYYFKKADRESYISDKYNLLGKPKDMGDYYIVEFDSDHVSTIGANGFIIRRQLLVKHALIDEEHCYHTDINVDLIRKGFNKYAFIKDDIIHLTNYKSISSFLYRRKLFMEQTHIQGTNKKVRRYSVYTSKDRMSLIKFILFASTFVKPTFDSIRGYMKIHDSAWFLHPFLSFVLLLLFSYTFINAEINKYVKKLF